MAGGGSGSTCTVNFFDVVKDSAGRSARLYACWETLVGAWDEDRFN